MHNTLANCTHANDAEREVRELARQRCGTLTPSILTQLLLFLSQLTCQRLFVVVVCVFL